MIPAPMPVMPPSPVAGVPMPSPPPIGAPGAPMPSGQPPVTIDAVMALLRDGMMRRFRIDIEVDSTIAGDEAQERQDRTEFITATTGFIEKWAPIVAANPMMAPLAGELLLFGARSFRISSSMEEVIEETVDKLEEQAAQPKPPPEPSPEDKAKIAQAQIKAQAEGQKAQADIAATQVKAQSDEKSQQLDLAGKVLEHQQNTAEHVMEMDRLKAQAATDALALHNEAVRDQHKHELSIEQMNHQAKMAKQKPKADK